MRTASAKPPGRPALASCGGSATGVFAFDELVEERMVANAAVPPTSATITMRTTALNGTLRAGLGDGGAAVRVIGWNAAGAKNCSSAPGAATGSGLAAPTAPTL